MVRKGLQQAISYSDYRDQIKLDIILQKESSADVENKSLADRELFTDKNPVTR